jgi:hypothetical protein
MVSAPRLLAAGLVAGLAGGLAGDGGTAAQGPPCSPRPVVVGVNVQGEGRFDLARRTQVGWVRIDLPWSQVNPAPEVWDFGSTDAQVAAARAEGLEVLAILSRAPAWLGGGERGTRPPADLDPWRQFVARAASRYAGRIAAYEVWNEPDFFDEGTGVGWNAAARLYLDYLHAAAREIRRLAPGTLVAGPALSSGPTPRTAELLRLLESTLHPDGRAIDDLDVVTLHANVLDDDGVGQWLTRLLGNKLYPLASLLPSAAGKPIWVTELGWTTAEVGETSQSANLAEALRHLSGASDWPSCANVGNFRLTHAFVYKLMDGGGESAGIYRGDATPKPAALDLARRGFPATEGSAPRATFEQDCRELRCDLRQTTFAASGPWTCAWELGDGRRREGCTLRHDYERRGSYLVSLSMRLATLRLEGSGWLAATCADTTPPRLRLLRPRAGDVVTGLVRVEAEASDDDGPLTVDFLVDGQRRATRRHPGPYRFTWDTRRYPDGAHKVGARAHDRCANVTSLRRGGVTVTVDNPDEP